MKTINDIRTSFHEAVSIVCSDPSVYAKSPQKDFSRNRKLPMDSIVRFILSAHTESIPKELLKFFKYDVHAPSASAFVQQRQKLKPQLFIDLMHLFNRSLGPLPLYKGYRLLAADGSDIHYATNPKEPENYFRVGDAYDYNLIHLNALYDIRSGIYTDALIQMRRQWNEKAAAVEMIDRSDIPKAIVLMDRGFESYNVMAHIIEKGWAFVLRVRTDAKKSIAAPFNLPMDSLDKHVTLSYKEAKQLDKRAS